jgi:hypothetical protein
MFLKDFHRNIDKRAGTLQRGSHQKAFSGIKRGSDDIYTIVVKSF